MERTGCLSYRDADLPSVDALSVLPREKQTWAMNTKMPLVIITYIYELLMKRNKGICTMCAHVNCFNEGGEAVVCVVHNNVRDLNHNIMMVVGGRWSWWVHITLE